MLALTWEQIAEEHITVNPLKTKNSTNKKLRISKTLEVEEVLALLKTKSGNCFQTISGTQYTSAGFDSTWKRVMVKYVSNGGLRFHEHDLRGKVATDMQDASSAKALLGHKKISMTEEYIKARRTDVVQPATRRNQNGKPPTNKNPS